MLPDYTKCQINTKHSITHSTVYLLCPHVPQTSFPWLCSAVTSSPARGNFQQDVLPAHRASSLAVAGSFSLPPHQLSETNGRRRVPKHVNPTIHASRIRAEDIYVSASEFPRLKGLLVTTES